MSSKDLDNPADWLSEENDFQDVFAYIKEWKPTSDVFPLRNFYYATSLATAGSAAYISQIFRKSLKLGKIGYFSTFVPVVILPSLFATALHFEYVHKRILMASFKCPVCIEMRSGILQFVTGIAYPLLFSPFACLQFSERRYTYNMPSINEAPSLFFKECLKFLRPHKNVLYAMALFQFIGGMAWSHWELACLSRIAYKAVLMEEAVKKYHESKNL